MNSIDLSIVERLNRFGNKGTPTSLVFRFLRLARLISSQFQPEGISLREMAESVNRNPRALRFREILNGIAQNGGAVEFLQTANLAGRILMVTDQNPVLRKKWFSFLPEPFFRIENIPAVVKSEEWEILEKILEVNENLSGACFDLLEELLEKAIERDEWSKIGGILTLLPEDRSKKGTKLLLRNLKYSITHEEWDHLRALIGTLTENGKIKASRILLHSLKTFAEKDNWNGVDQLLPLIPEEYKGNAAAILWLLYKDKNVSYPECADRILSLHPNSFLCERRICQLIYREFNPKLLSLRSRALHSDLLRQSRQTVTVGLFSVPNLPSGLYLPELTELSHLLYNEVIDTPESPLSITERARLKIACQGLLDPFYQEDPHKLAESTARGAIILFQGGYTGHQTFFVADHRVVVQIDTAYPEKRIFSFVPQCPLKEFILQSLEKVPLFEADYDQFIRNSATVEAPDLNQALSFLEPKQQKMGNCVIKSFLNGLRVTLFLHRIRNQPKERWAKLALASKRDMKKVIYHLRFAWLERMLSLGAPSLAQMQERIHQKLDHSQETILGLGPDSNEYLTSIKSRYPRAYRFAFPGDE